MKLFIILFALIVAVLYLVAGAFRSQHSVLVTVLAFAISTGILVVFKDKGTLVCGHLNN
jgi:hypothetical protein